MNLKLPSKRVLYALTGITGLMAVSYISSVLFYAFVHMDPGLARPWTVWYFLADPYSQAKAGISLAGATVGLVAPIAWFLFSKYLPKEKHLGGARWANWQDIRKAGLFAKKGLLLGKYRGQYLISNSPTHALVVAPTRSGKGVGLVIPNLLNWADSVICLDLKQENYRITSGFRAAHGHDIYMWAPVSHDLKSHRYNPLDSINKDPHRKISDVQTIAKILVPDPSHGDDFWVSEARALFTGLVLYVLDSPETPSTIGSVYRILGAEGDLGDICRHIVKNYDDLPTGGKKTLMSFANKADKERSGVKSSLDKALQLWTEPVIDTVTSGSDFSFTELRKKKMSIYVGVPTDQVSRLASLLRVFFEQAIAALSSKEPGNDEPYKVLLLMDEMHMLGDMASMTTAFSLLAGYNCRVMAVVQNLSLLDQVYGRNKRNGILAGCAHQVFFAPNDLETPDYVSKSCGDKVVETVSVSKKNSFKYEPVSRNIGQKVVPLLSSSELKLFAADEQIIVAERSRPIRSRKIVYHEDKNLMGRVLPPPEVPALKIEEQKIPTFNIPRRNKPDDLPDGSAPIPHNPSHGGSSLDGLLDLFPEEPSGPIAAEGFVNSILKALQDED